MELLQDYLLRDGLAELSAAEIDSYSIWTVFTIICTEV